MSPTRRGLLPLLAVPAAAPRTARAQAWTPDRPIRFIVGFAPGGSTDTTARVIGQAISGPLGQSVVIENRTGAGGNIATEHVARSAPDGYTLVVASMGTQATNAALYRTLPFDPVRDFTAVTLIALSATVLVVHPSVPARTTQELIAMARAQPGRLNYGTGGSGSSQHFAAAMFEHQAGIRMNHVAYRGGAPAMADLVAGRVDLVFSPIVEAQQQVRAGQVRALGVTAERRHPALPDTPTVSEGLPGYVFNSWLGLFAPAGTPRAAVERIAREVATAMRSGPSRERMEALGYEPVGSTPEEFERFFLAELPRVAEIVRISGARVE